MKTHLVKLVFVLAAFLDQQAGAQQIGTPDMSFYLDFAPVDVASSNLDLRGECSYNKFIRIPDFISGAPTFTNDLEVAITLPSKPNAAWLLEKQRDGSFREMAELTSYLNSDNGIYIDQHFRLTKNQIHSLIKGDWYTEVDFWDAKYIGNLTPAYQFANGPTAVIDFLSPVFYHEMGYGYVVIAKANHTADVIVHETQSVDPYYLPIMGYTWKVYDYGTLDETKIGPVLFHRCGVGDHYIILQVHDAIADGQVSIGFTVFTPSQAINYISPSIQGLPIPQKRMADLTVLLSQAAEYFDQEKMVQGRRKLMIFIGEIKKLNSNGETKPWILKYSQRLLDALVWQSLPSDNKFRIP
jgi:hypothetical protein